jgi:phosphoglycerate dehydrogenase-like enzyme
VEERLRCFGVRVIRVARHAREGVHAAEELMELLPQADSVLIHLPETDETRGLVGEAFLARMRPGAILINASRGALVDNDALLGALRAGHIPAAIDNTDPEPLPDGHVLWSAPDLLITPHVGSRSPRAHDRLTQLLYEQLDRYVQGAPLANVVEGAY